MARRDASIMRYLNLLFEMTYDIDFVFSIMIGGTKGLKPDMICIMYGIVHYISIMSLVNHNIGITMVLYSMRNRDTTLLVHNFTL